MLQKYDKSIIYDHGKRTMFHILNCKQFRKQVEQYHLVVVMETGSCVRSQVQVNSKTINWICYFPAKHTTLSSKSKHWFARSQDNNSG